MGDEVRRTQGGNNNAYCQDDPTSWFDWALVRAPRRRARFTAACSAAASLRDPARRPDGISLLDLLAARDKLERRQARPAGLRASRRAASP